MRALPLRPRGPHGVRQPPHAHGHSFGGAAVSNACPRCRWLVRSLDAWPAWDGSPVGAAVFRHRVWGEVVVAVRAASKALVLPFAALHLGGAVGLPPSLSAFLAFSYLGPWAWENRAMFQAAYRSEIFARNRRRQHRRAQLRPGPQAQPRADAVDCGAAARAPAPEWIPSSEALANLLAATPVRVSLVSGDVCSVCIEPFPEEAAAAAAALPGAEAAQALRALSPPVVALRCGHALHVKCAEAAVAAVQDRHVRCPLCREPVSLAGAVSSRMFS